MKVFFLFIFFCLTSSTTFAATGYTITSGGGSQYISEWGLCANVTNNLSLNLFVPTKTRPEFFSFLSASIPGVVVSYQGCTCASLLLAGNTSSGLYDIDPLNTGSTINVYCDMATNGGGWMLVARSVAGASSTAFGWKQSTGSVSNDSLPYSINTLTTGLVFSETMFGSYSSAKNWGAYVYSKSWSATDITTNGNSNVSSSTTSVIGGTTGAGMLNRMGYTDLTTSFYFRDISGTASYGLNFAGWSTAYNNNYGAYLNTTQGMIMVR